MTYRVRNPGLHQEDDVISPARVLLALFVTLVISGVLVVWAVQAVATRRAELRPSGGVPERWLGPRHMVSQVREDVFGEQRGRTLQGQQRAVLDGYGWVDRDLRTVHVPIERAIDWVVAGRQP